MKKTAGSGIFLAILAAALYALNAPLSKLLLAVMPIVGAWLCAKDEPIFRKKNKNCR